MKNYLSATLGVIGEGVNRTHVGKSGGKMARDSSLIARYGNDGDERGAAMREKWWNSVSLPPVIPSPAVVEKTGRFILTISPSIFFKGEHRT